MLRKIRIVLGIAVLFSMTLFFFDVIDFLGVLPKLQLIPSLLAANLLSMLFLGLLTLLFGRIYCSIFCPLGILQDVFIWVSRKTTIGKKRFCYSPAWTKLRYTVLATMVISIVVGVALIPAMLDPYSIYGRIATHLLNPIWISINNLLMLVGDKFDLYLIAKKPLYLQSLEAMFVSIASILTVGYMAGKYGRLYCNTICPAGTMLGVLSRFSFCKIIVNPDKCNRCGACAAKCKASCIDSQTQQIDHSRCINCFDCISTCRQKAISFTTPISAPIPSENVSSEGVSRRAFLTTSVFTLTGAAATMTQAMTSIPSSQLPSAAAHVLPPGATNKSHFSTHCTSCHLCVSKCPSQTLKPLVLSNEISAMMQPAMDFKRGYCEYDCNLCGTVCPNQAIKSLSLEQKQNTKIGYAVFAQPHCVVLTDEVNCGNCAVHCPTKAITMIAYKDKKIPTIDLSRCIGCGSCEYHCPANPGAIHVVGFAE